VEPARVKLYGLFSLTKRRYVAQQACAVFLVLILFAVWCFARPILDKPVARRGHVELMNPSAADRPVGQYPELALLTGVLNAVPWVAAAMLLAIVVESLVVLRLFARKESAAQPAAPPPQVQEARSIQPQRGES
jgi:hypothetical protein